MMLDVRDQKDKLQCEDARGMRMEYPQIKILAKCEIVLSTRIILPFEQIEAEQEDEPINIPDREEANVTTEFPTTLR